MPKRWTYIGILLGACYLIAKHYFRDVPVFVWMAAGIVILCLVLGIWVWKNQSFGRKAKYLRKPLVMLSGTEFESVVYQLLVERGYSCRHTGQTGDQGVDIIAAKGGKQMAVQAKRWQGSVGNQAVQQVFAGMRYYRCDSALLVTNSYLTPAARDAAAKLQIAYVEGAELTRWLQQSSLKHLASR